MKRKQNGFTLVELLVVIAIIGILMGLTIPAVQAAREAARKMDCANNVRSIALGAVQHEIDNGHFPHWVDKYGFFAGGTDPSDLNNFSGSVPAHVKIGGFGVELLPYLDAQPSYEHWTEDRYPISSKGGDIEASSGASGVGFHGLASPNLAIFQCPSNPVSLGSHGKNSYVSNNGMSQFRTTSGHDSASPGPVVALRLDSQAKANGTSVAGYFGRNGSNATDPLFRVADPPNQGDIKDGLSNTLLYSENVQALPWHRPGYMNAVNGSTAGDLVPNGGPNDIQPTDAIVYARYTNGIVWHYEDPRSSELNGLTGPPGPTAPTSPTGKTVFDVFKQHTINGGGNSVSEDIFVLTMEPPSSQQVNYDAPSLARPSSAHNDGVNSGFADGSTRFVGDTIDYRVYQAMLTPRGKSSDVPWPEFVLTDEIQ